MPLISSSREFIQWVTKLELIDMPLVGRKFTWFKRRSCSRLNRVTLEIE